MLLELESLLNMRRVVPLVMLVFLLAPTQVFAVTYDMVVEASSIIIAPLKPHVGQLAKVYVIVKNIGTQDVEGIVVFNDGDKLIGRKSLSLKAGGSNEDVWTTWLPATSGSHLVRVSVVNDSGYPDASPENNSVERAIVVEGDPDPPPILVVRATSTTSHTNPKSGLAAATTTVVASSTATLPASSRTTEKVATPLISQQTVHAPSVQNARRLPADARRVSGSERAMVSVKSRAVPVVATTTQALSVIKIGESGSPLAVEKTTTTVKELTLGSLEKPARRQDVDVASVLWIGAAASALLALLFYFVSRRNAKQSSD